MLAPYCGSAMRVLFFGTYDADSHPRVAVLRDGLGAALRDSNPGAADSPTTVDECNVPLGLSTAARVSMLRQPWLLPRLALRLATCWATLIRRARRRPRPDVVVVGYLGHFDVLLARRLFRDVPIVLDHLIGASDTATDRGVSGGPAAAAAARPRRPCARRCRHRRRRHRGASRRSARGTSRQSGRRRCRCPHGVVHRGPRHRTGRCVRSPVALGRVLRSVHPAAGHADDRCRSRGHR